MSLIPRPASGFFFALIFSIAAFLVGNSLASAQDSLFQLDPAHTSVKMTLGAALHSVHGAFQLKAGALQLDRASGKISGAIIVDARSGQTGNGMRDRKMNKDVLETDRYPEISFRAESLEGAVAATGKSSVKIHGMFSVHGSDHEITMPAEVDIDSDQWTASAHFTIPYAQWGIKNPSNLFLHVSDSVEIAIEAAGTVTNNSKAAMSMIVQ